MQQYDKYSALTSLCLAHHLSWCLCRHQFDDHRTSHRNLLPLCMCILWQFIATLFIDSGSPSKGYDIPTYPVCMEQISRGQQRLHLLFRLVLDSNRCGSGVARRRSQRSTSTRTEGQTTEVCDEWMECLDIHSRRYSLHFGAMSNVDSTDRGPNVWHFNCGADLCSINVSIGVHCGLSIVCRMSTEWSFGARLLYGICSSASTRNL